jgi:hypothetical protein
MPLINPPAPVSSVAGKQGDVSLEVSDVNSLGFTLSSKVGLSMINAPNGVMGLDADGNAVGTWQVRQGTSAQLAGTVAEPGEPVLNTDTGVLYVGWNNLSPGIAVGRPVTKTVPVDTTVASALNVDATGYDVVRLTCSNVDVSRARGFSLAAGTAVGQRVRVEWDFTAKWVTAPAGAQLTLTFTDVLSNAVKMTSGFDDSGSGYGMAGSMEVVWADLGAGFVGWLIEAYRPGVGVSQTSTFPYGLNVGSNSVGAVPTASGGIVPCGAVGLSNIVSGAGSFAVGSSNTLQAGNMLAIGQGNGQTGTSNMSYSLLLGQNNRAGNVSSLVMGNRAKGGLPYGYYQASESAGASSSYGTTQYERHVPCGQTTDATPKDLKIGNNNTIGDFVRLIGAGAAGAYDISVVGWSHTLQESFAIWFRALIQRDTSNNTTIVGSTEIARISGTNMTGCNVGLSMSAANSGHLAITVTGLAANTITWTAAAKAVVSQQVTR